MEAVNPLFENLEQVDDGQTPLEPDDLDGLIPQWIGTRGELNALEQENIVTATIWTRKRTWSLQEITDYLELAKLHKRMFCDVWTWAGRWRRVETNLGVAPEQITTQLRMFGEDVRIQTEDVTNFAFTPHELLARFHHRLVSIHPFPNGNGRHARLATDILAGTLDQRFPTWGNKKFTTAKNRQTYLAALRQADQTGDFTALINFMFPTPTTPIAGSTS